MTESLNTEENDKLALESYYKDIIRTKHEKVLERLPDVIQELILSFVDVKTRLRILRAKYPRSHIMKQIMALPNTHATIDHLIQLTKYVSPILKQVLDHEGYLYQTSYLYTDDLRERILHFLGIHFDGYSRYYTELLTYTIDVALKHYTKMYTISPPLPAQKLIANELAMIRVYAQLLLVVGIRQPSNYEGFP